MLTVTICLIFQDLIDNAMKDYELIEDFYYSLSTDDFITEWVDSLYLHVPTTFKTCKEMATL